MRGGFFHFFAFTQPLFVTQATESRMYTVALLFFTCANLLGYEISGINVTGESGQISENTKNTWMAWVNSQYVLL